MNIEHSSHIKLLDDLDKLSTDYRLARVFGQNSSDNCVLRLWLIELKEGKNKEYRLLFGLVTPISFSSSGDWSKRVEIPTQKLKVTNENDKIKPFADEFSIVRLNLYTNGNNILRLVKEMCKGNTLAKACEEINFKAPPEKYGQLCLAQPRKQVADLFAVRPLIFLANKNINCTLYQNLQPTASPTNAPTFIGSLWRIDKVSLFLSENGKAPLPDGLIKKVLTHLLQETGLAFDSTDSERLGNFEWWCFSGIDEYENSQVKISWDSSCVKAFIEILSDVLPVGTEVLVNCRLYNDRVVILDQCKAIQIQGKTQVEFDAKEQEINKVLVTIWIRSEQESLWQLWYEDSVILPKGININMGIVTHKGVRQSDWLQAFTNSKVQERLDQAKVINRVHYERLEINRGELSPWIPANEQIRKLTRQLFPKSSGGRFFLRNMDSSDDPSRLSFFEWLKALTDNHNATQVLIIDPYFDEFGIELLARATSVQADYVVITNTQANSDYWKELDKPREPKRATRLQEEVKKFQISLSQMNIELIDLRNNKQTTDQLFHDRYILIFEQDLKINRGYHLSNSLQGATKNHPLLVTPIPSDVLEDVANYIVTLLDDSLLAEQDARKLPLYSSKKSKVPKTQINAWGVSIIPYAGLFFAALLQENILLYVDELELEKYLQNEGVLIKENESFKTSSKIHGKLEYFIQVLLASSTDNFAKLWTAFSTWLHHTDDNESLNTVINSGGQELILKLKDFLANAPEQKYPIGTLEARESADCGGLMTWLLQDFRTGIKIATTLLNQAEISLDFYDKSGTRYATEALVEICPDKLVDVVLEMRNSLISELLNNGYTSKYWSIANTLTSILNRVLKNLISIHWKGLENSRFLSALLTSDIPLIRAVSVASISPIKNDSINIDEALKEIEALPEIELIYSLSLWISEAAKISNLQNGENTKIKAIYGKIIDKLCLIWINELSNEEIHDIILIINDSIEGKHTLFINNEILLSLEKENKLTLDQITDIWLTILFEWLKSLVCDSNKRQNEYFVRDIRLEIYIQLRRLEFTSSIYSDISNIVSQLSDLKEENWKEFQSNKFISDLKSENRLDDTHILQLWLTIIFHRAKQLLKENTSHHYQLVDSIAQELTEVCGWSLANATTEKRQEWFTKFQTEIQKPSQQWLYKLFARSRNFADWEQACISIILLRVLTNFTYFYGLKGESISNYQEVEKLNEYDKELENILININESSYTPTMRNISEFLTRVKQKNQELINAEDK